jgi:O-antigen/teichoic acid export membrane protein
VPAVLVAALAPHLTAGLLTAGGQAQEQAAELLPWLVPAAAAQIYAGVAASALAALDDAGVADLGGGLGALAGLGLIVALVGHGVVAFGWGLALNAAIAAALPAAALAARGALAAPAAGGIGRRLWELAEGVTLPFALQVMHLLGDLLDLPHLPQAFPGSLRRLTQPLCHFFSGLF